MMFKGADLGLFGVGSGWANSLGVSVLIGMVSWVVCGRGDGRCNNKKTFQC